ncbi:MAG: gliding motility protein GldM [Bacteroidota bacterium]|nr:gliding motility protein GldM [Bacteroidota bacterium]
MARHKETPRQKLISMMYLVLTAMLALNVSREVINGYSAVNDSVLSTNQNLVQQRSNVLANFKKEYALNEIEVKPFLEKAKVAIRLSAEMSSYIANLRDELISVTERIPLAEARRTSFGSLKKKDNYTIPTNYLIGSLEDGSAGKAQELKQKMMTYRRQMMALISPKYRKQLKLGFETDDRYFDENGKTQSWAFHYFYDIPLAADVTILNKFISEVSNAELEVVNDLLNESIAEDFKYDRIEAKVLPKSNYLFTGDQYEAEVIVAAYDTSHSPSPSVFVARGIDSLPVSQRSKATRIARDHGRLKLKIPATGAGLQKYAGFVSVPTNSGRERTYHFSGEYFVAQPSMTVSATNMNVLYIGVNNPLSISVPGIPKEAISPAISAGTLRQNRSNGGWIATVPAGCQQATIAVSARINGTMRRIGTEVFRVKKLPDPDPYIIGNKDEYVSRNNLIAAGKIIARMPADFEFDYSFQVVSFKMSMQRGFNVYHYDAQGEKLTAEMIQQIKKTNRGQVIIFEDIVVRGPEGINRNLSPLFITIK